MKQARFGFFLVRVGNFTVSTQLLVQVLQEKKRTLAGPVFVGRRWMDEFTTYTRGPLSGKVLFV